MASCVICGTATTNKCSACKIVYYCSRKHQETDWKNHKTNCQPFQIEENAELGRHLVAKRDIKLGDVIIIERPLVYGPKVYRVKQGSVPCLGCFKKIFMDSGNRCRFCRWPVCNQSCPGLKDPEIHGIECIILAMRKLKEPVNGDLYDFFRYEAIFVLRCFLLQTRWPNKFETLMRFGSHLDNRNTKTNIYDQIENRVVRYLMENFVKPFKQYEKNVKHTFLETTTNELFHKIAGIIDVNCMEISNEVDLSAIYEKSSLMEHNCIPNAVYTFDSYENQFRITVKAATKISKGDHIKISYTNLLWGTYSRIEHLNDTKYFTCKCDRCKDPTELNTNFSALKCSELSKTQCAGYIESIEPCNLNSDWLCNRCSRKIHVNEIVKVIHELGNGVEKLQNTTPTIGELELFLSKLEIYLHPNHYFCYAIKYSLVQLYGYQQGYLAHQLNDELLEKKIDFSLNLIATTEILDPARTRLNLYSAVLYHELHLARLQLFKRKWHNLPSEKLNLHLQEIMNLVNKAIEFLDPDTNVLIEQKLLDVIGLAKRSFVRWTDEKKFNFVN